MLIQSRQLFLQAVNPKLTFESVAPYGTVVRLLSLF